MIAIHLKPLHHRGQESIGIFFENYPSLNGIVKKLPGVKWSQTKKVWYVPLNNPSYNNVYNALKGKVELVVTELKEYLEKRKKVAAPAPVISNKSKDKPIPTAQPLAEKKSIGSPVATAKPLSLVAAKSQSIPIAPSSPVLKLCPANLEALEKFVQHLKLKAYSESTITTYRNEFMQLLQLLKKKRVNDLTADDLKRYMVYCYEKLKLTENTLHSRINALPRWI